MYNKLTTYQYAEDIFDVKVETKSWETPAFVRLEKISTGWIVFPMLGTPREAKMFESRSYAEEWMETWLEQSTYPRWFDIE